MTLPTSRRSEAHEEIRDGDRASGYRDDAPANFYLRAICLMLMDVDDKLAALLERAATTGD